MQETRAPFNFITPVVIFVSPRFARRTKKKERLLVVVYTKLNVFSSDLKLRGITFCDNKLYIKNTDCNGRYIFCR